ncbi:MAG: NDP-sugar synthase [Nitrospirae bacterium]|nr:NDP-sugar synthase [Nitrospirota bacterium]
MAARVDTAMVLAAGRGERLRPLTERVPKPLVPVGGRPMVAHVLALLARHGITRVHMNTHHLGERLPDALGDGRRFGVTVTYHPEDVLLGTGGGLLNARHHNPELADGPFVMINADVLCDVDLSAVIARHLQTGALATLVLRPDPAQAAFGILAFDDGGRIRRFLEVDTGPAPHERMFTGIQVLSPGIFRLMPDGGAFPITDCYKAALRAGMALAAFDHAGYWNDLGTPERLLNAEADIAAGRFVPPVAP